MVVLFFVFVFSEIWSFGFSWMLRRIEDGKNRHK